MTNPLIRSYPKKVNKSLPNKSAGILEDFSVRKTIATREAVTGDHNSDGDKPEIVNVCYGTDETPPTASSTPIGTIYVQYTA